MAQLSPDAAAIRAELERVLSSRCFAQAERHKAFLRFVVEETLAGRSDRLKGYTIGVQVFERPEDFDAQSDPLVRVEAGRLRRRLAEYYATEGQDDAVRIELSRGSYAAGFSFARPREPSQEPPAPAPVKSWHGVLATLGAVAVLVAASAWFLLRHGEPEIPTAAGPEQSAIPGRAEPVGAPKLFVARFADLSDDPKLGYFAYGISEEIMLRLKDYELVVLTDDSLARGSEPAIDLAALQAAASVDYALTGSIRSAGSSVRIAARLVDAKNGQQLWAMAFDEDLSLQKVLDVQERIAGEVVNMIAVPFGAIFESELSRTTHKPPETLESYDCVLKYYYYRNTMDAAQHGNVIDCFRNAISREPAYAAAWGGLALAYVDAYVWFAAGQGSAEMLAKAGEAARTALDLDGNSLLGNLAMARVRFVSGDLDGFERSAELSLALGPNDPETLLVLASYYTVSGRPERGLPLADRALALLPNPPGRFNAPHTFDRLRAGDGEAALDLALKIDLPGFFLPSALVAAAAGLAHRPEVAERALKQALALNPNLAGQLDSFLDRNNVDQQLRRNLLEGLRLAGLEISE